MRLSVTHLACGRAGRRVLADVTFAVGAGEAMLVTGRNGAGKSTLLAALAGLIRPTAGTIALSGLGDRPLSECVHHLGHRDGLKSALGAAENLVFVAGLLGAPRMAAGSALERVGLGAAGALPVAWLSAGQRRRLTLARLLVAHRPVWLLDEPTTALDQDGQALLAALLAEHLRAGGAVVAATHAPLAIPGARSLVLARPDPGGASASGQDPDPADAFA